MSHFHRQDEYLLDTDGRIDLAQSLTEIAIGLNGFRYDREDWTAATITVSNALKTLIKFCFPVVLSCILLTGTVKKVLEKKNAL